MADRRQQGLARILASDGAAFDVQDALSALGTYNSQLPPAPKPYSQRLGEALLTTWPAQMAKSAFQAATLPGDVYAGKVDPLSEQGIARSLDLAGLVTLGSGALPAAKGAGAELRMGLKYSPPPQGVEIKQLSPSYLVAKSEGREIGQISLSEKNPFVSLIQVDPQHRGKGIGAALYSEAERALGKDLVPSPLGLSDDAKRFWEKQLAQMPEPEARALIEKSRQIGLTYGIKPEHIEDRVGNLIKTAP